MVWCRPYSSIFPSFLPFSHASNIAQDEQLWAGVFVLLDFVPHFFYISGMSINKNTQQRWEYLT